MENIKDIRLVGVDLDGTLLNDDKQLCDGAAATISRLAERGVYFVPITGRPLCGVPACIRRHPDIPGTRRCMTCGAFVAQPTGRREKKFCSDKCRMAWWNSHPEAINKKAYYTLVCEECGKEFESYGNNRRKYCCRNCYLNARRAKSV